MAVSPDQIDPDTLARIETSVQRIQEAIRALAPDVLVAPESVQVTLVEDMLAVTISTPYQRLGAQSLHALHSHTIRVVQECLKKDWGTTIPVSVVIRDQIDRMQSIF